MTTRRFPAPMLYGPRTSVRWLRTLVAAIEQTATGLCREQWPYRLVPRPQAVPVMSVARIHSRLK